ncbi:MAG: hypothetical protein ACI89J_001810 [Hyphomicrobiaceae bacterium]|jgi:hypothetical protein
MHLLSFGQIRFSNSVLVMVMNCGKLNGTARFFFDLDKRLGALSDKGDPLEVIDAAVPRESFRIAIEAAVCPNRDERKSNAGRKAYDAMRSRNSRC